MRGRWGYPVIFVPGCLSGSIFQQSFFCKSLIKVENRAALLMHTVVIDYIVLMIDKCKKLQKNKKNDLDS